jgi:hypothetical protein
VTSCIGIQLHLRIFPQKYVIWLGGAEGGGEVVVRVLGVGAGPGVCVREVR